MIQAYYTSANTMIAQQKKINVIAGNISNVNTDGYKKTDMAFQEMLYTKYNENFGDGRTEAIEIGNGVMTAGVIKDFSKGTLVATGNALELAMDGDGFFVLAKGNGDTVYTRGGAFQISVEEDGSYIVDNSGYYLMDENMEKVAYSDGMIINSDGAVSQAVSYEVPVADGDEAAETEAEETTGVKLMVAAFADPAKLTALGNCSYRANNDSGAAQIAENAKVMQGYAEKSNVDLALEMTDLIKVQRIYQMNSKIVQTVDEMKALANRLRK